MFVAKIAYPEYDSTKNFETKAEAAWYVRDRMTDELAYCLKQDGNKVTAEIRDDEIIISTAGKDTKTRFSVEDDGQRIPIDL